MAWRRSICTQAGAIALSLGLAACAVHNARLDRVANEVEHAARLTYPVELEDKDGVYAHVNVRHLHVTRGMVAFAADDSELAFVVAHELAHVLLNDFAAYREAEFDHRSLDFAADALGIRLAARADYDPEKGAQLLLRLAEAFPEIASDPAYPTPQERYERLEREIAQMGARP
jgi:predicted Zn-dependent protease